MLKLIGSHESELYWKYASSNELNFQIKSEKRKKNHFMNFKEEIFLLFLLLSSASLNKGKITFIYVYTTSASTHANHLPRVLQFYFRNEGQALRQLNNELPVVLCAYIKKH